jgi:L-lactate dehydrogenase complex protein LldG
MQSDARTQILNRIRAAIPQTGADDVSAAWARLPRDYRKAGTGGVHERLERLTDRLHDYDAQVLAVEPAGLQEAIARMLTARGVARMVVPQGFPADLLPEGFSFAFDTGLTALELNGFEGILTECTLAIAETGTIVLQNVPGQGRRAATLVPDYHLCVVEAAKVVATVPEAIELLKPTAHLPTTFISGPSATADIEMTRIKGVHGPRFLDVLLVTTASESEREEPTFRALP